MARPGDAATLVIQTAFLGDVVLTTPLLAALAERFGPVDVVTTPAAAALLETHPAVRQVIRHDKHGPERGVAGMLRLAGRLRAERYPRVYLPHQSWRSGLLARLAGIPERIGFAHAPARWCYTRRVALPKLAHEGDRLLALADAAPGALPTLGITAADQTAASVWLAAERVPQRFVVMAPGSVWGTKRWGKYPALAAALDDFVVIVGGKEDRDLGEAIRQAIPGRAANGCGSLSLRQAAAVLQRAAVLVTNDSAPMHLAQATGTRTVALFGPTAPVLGFAPRGADDRVVEVAGLSCRPCSRHGPMRCPLGHHRCMVDLEVSEVVEIVRRQLATMQ